VREYPTARECDGALLRAFEPTARDSDVFCATAPKCGQTWVLTLLHHLKTGGRDPDFGGAGLFGVAPCLERPIDIGRSFERFALEPRLAELEALAAPRLFKMHVRFDEVPRPPGSAATVIAIYRDPRDLPYSMYRHLRGMHDAHVANPVSDDIDAYFERWLERGYVFEHLASFWPHRHARGVLLLRYEDLRTDVRTWAERLVDHLGWSVTDDALERALGLVDFRYMQRHESVAFDPDVPGFGEGERFFREGAVGKNRARLSEAQQARVVDAARAALPAGAFEFLMAQRVPAPIR